MADRSPRESAPAQHAAAPSSPEELLRSSARAGLITFEWDLAGRRLMASGAVEEVLGYTPDEIVANPKRFFEIVRPWEEGDIRDVLRRLSATGARRETLLLRVKSKDGREVPLFASMVAAMGPDGRPVSWQGFAHDLSAARAQVLEDPEGRARFEAIFEYAPLPVVLFDPKSLIIEQVNARAAELYGVTRDEMQGSFVSEYVAPSEWASAQEVLRGAMDADRRVSIMQRTFHRRRDGTLFPVQVAGVTASIGGRQMRLAIVRDLSDVEDAERQIQSLYSAIDVTPVATLLLDGAWAVIRANPAASAMLGRPVEDLRGRALTSFMDEPSAAALLKGQGSLAGGAPWQGSVTLAHGPRAGARSELTLTPVAEQQGTAVRYFAGLRGPSATQIPSELTAEDVGLFLDLLAHDVTNYLTAVRGYLELLSSDAALADRPRRMTAIAKAQAENALELIRDTRRVVGMERSRMQDSAKGDLVQVLDEASVRVEPVLSARKFKFRREFAVPKAPVLYADLMREVFVNLLHNSAKYDPHPEVVIDIVLEKGGTPQEPRWVVRVGDRGVGIPDEQKPHVFDRGYSRPRSQTPGAAMAPKGSGIGLSLCKFLVERSGGTIRVENRIPGDWRQGTNFIVELPAA